MPFTVTICSDRLVHMRQYSSVDRAVKRSSACATESLDRIFDAVTPVEVDVEFDGRRRLEYIADRLAGGKLHALLGGGADTDRVRERLRCALRGDAAGKQEGDDIRRSARHRHAGMNFSATPLLQ